jgi:signal transduction histidine kinase
MQFSASIRVLFIVTASSSLFFPLWAAIFSAFPALQDTTWFQPFTIALYALCCSVQCACFALLYYSVGSLFDIIEIIRTTLGEFNGLVQESNNASKQQKTKSTQLRMILVELREKLHRRLHSHFLYQAAVKLSSSFVVGTMDDNDAKKTKLKSSNQLLRQGQYPDSAAFATEDNNSSSSVELSALSGLDLEKQQQQQPGQQHDSSSSPRTSSQLMCCWRVFACLCKSKWFNLWYSFSFMEIVQSLNVMLTSRMTSEMKIASALQSNEHFIRYLFHEIRVPLNAMWLALSQLQESVQLPPQASSPNGSATNNNDAMTSQNPQQNPDRLEKITRTSTWDAGKQELLQASLEQTKFVSRILNDVLSLRKIEDGAFVLEMHPFSLSSLIQSTVNSFKAALEKKNLQLHYEVDSLERFAFDLPRQQSAVNLLSSVPPKVNVVGDKYRLRQVLSNFLSNAIKFTPKNGTITVGVKLRRLKLKDNTHNDDHQQLGNRNYNAVDKDFSTIHKLSARTAPACWSDNNNNHQINSNNNNNNNSNNNNNNNNNDGKMAALKSRRLPEKNSAHNSSFFELVLDGNTAVLLRPPLAHSPQHQAKAATLVQCAEQPQLQQDGEVWIPANTPPQEPRAGLKLNAQTGVKTRPSIDSQVILPFVPSEHNKSYNTPSDNSDSPVPPPPNHDRFCSNPFANNNNNTTTPGTVTININTTNDNTNDSATDSKQTLTLEPQPVEWTLKNDRVSIQVYVRDTGVGVPAEKVDKLFQPYMQILPGEQQYGKGTGLGLSISKSLMELHDGKVEYRPAAAEKQGSVFLLEFKSKIQLRPLTTKSILSHMPRRLSDAAAHNNMLFFDKNNGSAPMDDANTHQIATAAASNLRPQASMRLSESSTSKADGIDDFSLPNTVPTSPTDPESVHSSTPPLCAFTEPNRNNQQESACKITISATPTPSPIAPRRLVNAHHNNNIYNINNAYNNNNNNNSNTITVANNCNNNNNSGINCKLSLSALLYNDSASPSNNQTVGHVSLMKLDNNNNNNNNTASTHNSAPVPLTTINLPTNTTTNTTTVKAANNGLLIRVLFAEDHALTRKLTTRLLENSGWCTVVAVEDGEMAVQRCVISPEHRNTLQEAENFPFDVILMDGHMPRVNGVEATRHLRKIGLQIPIIAVTGNALDEDKQEFLAAGATAVLTKPIDHRNLLQTIAKYV